MADREKVIIGLECLTNEDPYMSTIACAEKKCPYAGIPDCNLAIWHDALELLKAQEPAKPRYDRGYRDYNCPACGVYLLFHQKYCNECGKALKWDE